MERVWDGDGDMYDIELELGSFSMGEWGIMACNSI